jgi:cation transport protein ChaC
MPLTRADLEADLLRRNYERHHPELALMPREAYEASLEAAVTGAGGDLWLFAYGSLIWNPLFLFAERRPARARDLHRRFCLWSRMGRGTAQYPGLMLALDDGGACDGFAFRIPAEHVREELTLIWRREMTLGSYDPRFVEVTDGHGSTLRALAFIARPDGAHYAGRLPAATVVEVLATASGRLGSAADYLYETARCLREHAIDDPALFDLEARVRARRSAYDAGSRVPTGDRP